MRERCGKAWLVGLVGLGLTLSCAQSATPDQVSGAGGSSGLGGAAGTGGGGTGNVDAGGSGGNSECSLASDCPAPPNECVKAECKVGKCTTSNVPSGTPATEQKTGDCKVNVCNGNGGFAVAVDDKDLPDDGKPCTDDTCSQGVASNTPKAVGTSCSNGLSCDAKGDCVGCISASLCPGVDTECSTRTCDAGTCGFKYAAAGTQLSVQTAGDCKVQKCDGAGGVTTLNDATDLPVDGKACTDDVCTNGVASNPLKPAGTACGGGLSCDSTGACAGCTSPSQCPGTDTECKTRSCSAGACGFTFTNPGTPVSSQTPGDCKVLGCDGSGNIVSSPSAADLPVDGKECTSDLCSAGVPSNPPLAAGTPCSQNGGKVCNGNGGCVECVSDSDCPGGSCQGNSCITTVCSAGTADCDLSASNGCECLGNLCCSGSCEPAHSNGLGQPFDSCLPLGYPGNAATYSLALALAARAAWPVAGVDGTCNCTPGAAACLFRQTATSCAVWVYEKTTAGYVYLNGVNNTCLCPAAGTTPWY